MEESTYAKSDWSKRPTGILHISQVFKYGSWGWEKKKNLEMGHGD